MFFDVVLLYIQGLLVEGGMVGVPKEMLWSGGPAAASFSNSAVSEPKY